MDTTTDQDTSNIILNVKQSPEDDRDFIYNSSSLEIKLILDFRSDLQSVRNQGTQGTCYAQSAACMKEWQEKRDYSLDEYLSPQFFYNNRDNLYDENQNNDEGMFGRNVMKLLKEIGICKENEYPYGLIQHRNEIDEGLYVKAYKNKISAYARINTLDNLKESLNKNGPCLITFPVYNYTRQLWKQNENDTFIGGHAMTVVGYLEDCFIIRNSWGPYWGDAGYCYYYFNDWNAHWEVWTTVDHIESVPEPDPDPVSDLESDNDLSDVEIISDDDNHYHKKDCPKCIIS